MLGLYFEEHYEGFTAALGYYDFTRENVLAFARKFDPQPFHLDDEAAARGPFGKLSASGWHTAAGWMKCYVASNMAARKRLSMQGDVLPEIGPSPGFTDLRWVKPVYPGDRVEYMTRVTGKRALASRLQWGLVFAHNEGTNQNGELVFSFDSKVLTARMV